MRFAGSALWAAVALFACAGAGAPPRDRCSATISSLQALEPTCWIDAGAPAPPPLPADSSPRVADDVPCPIPTSERVKPGAPPPPHLGPHQPFLPSPVERWRSALDGYVRRVTLDNQRPLGHERAICWAVYLSEMHKRIHPLFADSFLGSLDALPPGDPMNDQQLITRLEVVLTRDGRIQQMGVVKSSGVTAFDIAALDSVDRAQPFGPAPGAIVSSDGFAYLVWEFHRNEVYSCSTMGVRPYMLAVK
jgi:TonB family protein